MEFFLESSYVTASWDAENALIALQWTPETKYMQATDFKGLLQQAADFVEKKQVKYWLANTKKFDYVIDPDVQEWTAGAFNQRLINAGLYKMAVITPSEIFAHVSVQQTTNEMSQEQEEGVFQFSYFDDIDKARNWLLE